MAKFPSVQSVLIRARYVRTYTRSLCAPNDFSLLVHCCCRFGSDFDEQHTLHTEIGCMCKLIVLYIRDAYHFLCRYEFMHRIEIHVVRNSFVCDMRATQRLHVYCANGRTYSSMAIRFHSERVHFWYQKKKKCFLRVCCILAVAAVDVVVVDDVGIEFSMRADDTHWTHSIVLGARHASYSKRFYIQSVHWRIIQSLRRDDFNVVRGIDSSKYLQNCFHLFSSVEFCFCRP